MLKLPRDVTIENLNLGHLLSNDQTALSKINDIKELV